MAFLLLYHQGGLVILHLSNVLQDMARSLGRSHMLQQIPPAGVPAVGILETRLPILDAGNKSSASRAAP